MAKMVMLIDTKRCVGCHACAVACKLENNLPDGVWWNQVFTGSPTDFNTDNRGSFTEGRLPQNPHLQIDIATGSVAGNGGLVNDLQNGPVGVRMDYWTKACQHCEDPACLPVCPTGAIYVDPLTGIVDTDFTQCIGCRMCMNECPYDVRHYCAPPVYSTVIDSLDSDGNVTAAAPVVVGGQGINSHKENLVEKCTFCSHRNLIEGEKPACVDSCIATARLFGNIHSNEIAHLLRIRNYVKLSGKGTVPSVYYLTDYK